MGLLEIHGRLVHVFVAKEVGISDLQVRVLDPLEECEQTYIDISEGYGSYTFGDLGSVVGHGEG